MSCGVCSRGGDLRHDHCARLRFEGIGNDEAGIVQTCDRIRHGHADDVRHFPVFDAAVVRHNAVILHKIGENVPDPGRGDGTAVHHGNLRLIDHDETGELRIVRGQKADERGDEQRARDFTVLIVFLRRSGLAADGIVLHLRRRSAALFDNALQQLPHLCRGVRGDDAAEFRRFVSLDVGAVGGGDGAHDVGLHEHAAVDRSAGGVQHLHGCDGDALAEAHARKIRIADILAVDDTALVLAGDTAFGRRAEAKGINVIVKRVDAHFLRHLHERAVAGVLHGLCERLRAVSLCFPAADLFKAVLLIAFAAEGVLHRDRTGIERSRKRDDLKDRARLIGLGNGAVAAHLQQRGDVASGRRIQIEGRVGGAAEDLAGFRVHEQRSDLLCLVDRVALRDRGLNIGFRNGVRCERHVVAVDGGDVFLFAVGQRMVVSVDLGDETAVFAREVFVIGGLDARLALAVRAGKADELRKQVSHRVVALHVGRKADAASELERRELIDNPALDLPFQNDLLLFHTADALVNIVIIEPQHIRHLDGDWDAFGLGDDLRVDEHTIGRAALCEHDAVAVHDAPALGVQRRIARLLARRARRVFVALQDLHLEQTQYKREEDERHDDQENDELLLDFWRRGCCHERPLLSLWDANGGHSPPPSPPVGVGSLPVASPVSSAPPAPSSAVGSVPAGVSLPDAAPNDAGMGSPATRLCDCVG